jgi:hypothetical protein
LGLASIVNNTIISIGVEAIVFSPLLLFLYVFYTFLLFAFSLIDPCIFFLLDLWPLYCSVGHRRSKCVTQRYAASVPDTSGEFSVEHTMFIKTTHQQNKNQTKKKKKRMKVKKKKKK